MKLLIAVLAYIIVGAIAQRLKKEKDICLHAHNALRALHHETGTLRWDEELARGAEQWAMKLAREGGLRHSRGNYGENLYAAWGQSASCAKATLAWYNEIQHYDFNRGGFSSRTGHFTQVVWKGSTHLGVGIATSGNKIVVVARYSPAGNFGRRYRENVLRQKPGARVPGLSELENGSTGGPEPPVTEGPGPMPPPTEGPGPGPEPPSTEGPGPGPEPPSNLCLHAHNILRALHQNTGPMTWDDELARGSKEWAMKLAGENGLRHSRGNYGENLYAAWGQTANCAKATLAWYNEIKDYNFNRGGYQSGTGHFTQLVWKGSTRLGAAVVQRGNIVVVVARYAPAGNFISRFGENVFRQKVGVTVPSLREIESGITPPSTNRPQPPKPPTERPLPPTDRPLPPTERPLPPTERPLPPTNPPQPSSNLCLHAHNVLRALHQNTGPMTWDDELARGSKEWAMKLAGENGLRHSRGNYGENLYAAWGQTANCAKATLAWYNEIKDYNFNRGGYQSGTGHFTQLVWKGSTRLGAAVVQRGNIVVVVARYAPAGNFMSRFGENVFRQKFGARVPSLRELESGVTAPATDGPRPPVPATEQPLPPSNCKDMFTNCGVYRRKCNSNSWIRNRCKKTCNTC
ncbi:uncharacterized protein LOC135691294 isoform X1 [Rhopilema esculentum]|uniref:uncharacterized protein LOC135691294 isoform X1 n=1 Tax=Rhopilema esculentum TaxID=499914 RepID=UPI0031DC1391